MDKYRRRQKVFHVGNTSLIPDFGKQVEFVVEINTGLHLAEFGFQIQTITNLLDLGWIWHENLIKKLRSRAGLGRK